MQPRRKVLTGVSTPELLAKAKKNISLVVWTSVRIVQDRQTDT